MKLENIMLSLDFLMFWVYFITVFRTNSINNKMLALKNWDLTESKVLQGIKQGMSILSSKNYACEGPKARKNLVSSRNLKKGRWLGLCNRIWMKHDEFCEVNRGQIIQSLVGLIKILLSYQIIREIFEVVVLKYHHGC